MKRIELPEKEYFESLVKMFWGLEKFTMQPRVLFLIELIRESENGYLVINEKRQLIMDRLRITNRNFYLMLERLILTNDLRRENGILYFHPKWIAIKDCDGEFLISKKKSLGVKE